MTNAKASHRGRLIRAGLAIGTATAIVLAATSVTPAYAVAATVTVTPPAGNTATLTPITVTATTPWLAGVASPVVIFSVIACPTLYTAPTGAPTATTGGILVTDVRKPSDSMLALTVPTTVVVPSGSNLAQLKYNVCVYSGTSATSDNIGKGTYTVGTAASPQVITPNSGPTTGGNTVVVTGSAFPSTIGTTGIISATIDSVPMTGLKWLSSSAFSGVVPAHAASKNLTLAVTTPLGTSYLTNAYNYLSSISVSPNTAPASRGPVDVAIKGTQLLKPTFTVGAASNSSTAHVYLVSGTYNSVGASPAKATPPIAECTDVLVFSSTDMICRIQLWQRLVQTGVNAATIAAADTRTPTNVITTTGSAAITSATANFTQADVGQTIVDPAGSPNIPANTAIIAVQSATSATISATITTGATVTSPVIGGDRATTGTLTSTAGSSTIGSTVAEFLPTDVGRTVTTTGAVVPTGTVITSVASNKMSVTLSQPSPSGTMTGLTIVGKAIVPDGAYTATLVNDGSSFATAAAIPATYDQTAVTSGSTFTVANY